MSNDTHVISKHRLPVVFSASEVRRQRWLEQMYRMEPFPALECGSCGELACYVTNSRRAGEELVWYTYFCGECGNTFDEPVD